MKFFLEKLNGVESAHYYDIFTLDYIYSRGNLFWGSIKGKKFSVKIPIGNKKTIFMLLRIGRRALRLDKANATFIEDKKIVIIVYYGKIYRYNLEKKYLEVVHQLRQSRNTLHMAFANSKEYLFIGEYGNNKENVGVPIWRGEKDGKEWKKIYEFSPNKIKHVHGVYTDPYSNNIWVTTGDFEGQCWIIKADVNFKNLEWIGTGEQKYRSINLIFEKEKVCWAMDSPLEESFIFIMNRKTKEIERVEGINLPGPVWYMKKLEDGYLIQTSIEKGVGVKGKYANVYFSSDLKNWKILKSFKKDLLPMPEFKNGVIAFADGRQNKSHFLIFGEGLKKIDGKTFKGTIEEKK